MDDVVDILTIRGLVPLKVGVPVAVLAAVAVLSRETLLYESPNLPQYGIRMARLALLTIALAALGILKVLQGGMPSLVRALELLNHWLRLLPSGSRLTVAGGGGFTLGFVLPLQL